MVLVGVQPRFTQDPPTSPFSTMAVLRPALARATASGTPPCPVPMTTASNCSASPIGEPLVHLCSRAGVGRGVVQALVEKGLLVSWKAPLPRTPTPGDGRVRLEDSAGADATVASAPELEHRLTAEQMAAFETLDSALNSREPKREVLWG